MRGENSEIDLVDVSLFLIRKWLSIMIATFIFVAIGYVFCERAAWYKGCEYDNQT